MKPARAQHASALFAGLLFGVGLWVSGMTQPRKVLGFLDPFGRFDASLLLVMAAAIGVHAIGQRYRRGLAAPLFATSFALPARRDIDAKLLGGALLFGAGWGLSGYCPGAALVALPSGGGDAAVFMAALLAGMLATARLERLNAADSGTSPHT